MQRQPSMWSWPRYDTMLGCLRCCRIPTSCSSASLNRRSSLLERSIGTSLTAITRPVFWSRALNTTPSEPRPRVSPRTQVTLSPCTALGELIVTDRTVDWWRTVSSVIASGVTPKGSQTHDKAVVAGACASSSNRHARSSLASCSSLRSSVAARLGLALPRALEDAESAVSAMAMHVLSVSGWSHRASCARPGAAAMSAPGANLRALLGKG
mmetsp:Transcript_64587/g.183328  ORF Transcript_64587/g.183328 Transcript_64587/m.183328 type:complete len:211 (+) Transcript_64587:284-916(+)